MIPKHFKIEGLHTVRQLLQPLDFMTVIDLRAAYPTLGINPRYRNFFIFRFRGKFYRYRGTVFGASSLPRAFTKLLRPICAFLRTFGIRLVIFLDDILIMSASFAACAQDTQDVLMAAEESKSLQGAGLGFRVGFHEGAHPFELAVGSGMVRVPASVM